MAFYSEHAPRIWDDLYTVMIPDHVTLDPTHLRVFGTYSSGNKDVYKMMANNLTTVKIPIIKMVEYYDNGIVVVNALPNPHESSSRSSSYPVASISRR